MLELRGITKDFTGTRALDRVSLSVRPGEVVALMGENGAGKSTLMKILSGVWPVGSYEGELRVDGDVRSFRDTRGAHAAGIAMIHQELAVFPELTIAEHLELDRLPRWIRWLVVNARVQKFLDRLGWGLQAETRVGDLSVGGRQLVEIARALYRDARVIVFDEPTSALTDSEVERLDEVIDRLRSEGRAVVYITHRMDEVFRLADRAVVLRDGANAGEIALRKADGTRVARAEAEPKVISMMVGRSIDDVYPEKNTVFGEELLRVEGLSVMAPGGRRRVDDLSFRLRRGEVLGFAGLLGAGRTETLEAIFGALASVGPRAPGYRVTGTVSVGGHERVIGSPRRAIGLRMAFVSEDRKGSGLVLGQSIRSNLALPGLATYKNRRGTLKFIDDENERDDAEHWKTELRIRAADVDQRVSELSGGNQQKVVLAKWLRTNPEILFLDEPTRGIDIGAKVEIYQLIQSLAARGMGVIVASSEMPELLGLCHRLIVLREGKASAELNASGAKQEDVMRAAAL